MPCRLAVPCVTWLALLPASHKGCYQLSWEHCRVFPSVNRSLVGVHYPRIAILPQRAVFNFMLIFCFQRSNREGCTDEDEVEEVAALHAQYYRYVLNTHSLFLYTHTHTRTHTQTRTHTKLTSQFFTVRFLTYFIRASPHSYTSIDSCHHQIQ